MSTISFRTDEEVDAALRDLAGPGADTGERSAVIREAILLAARERRAQRLRAEAEAVANDPDDVAEVRAIQSEMDYFRAW